MRGNVATSDDGGETWTALLPTDQLVSTLGGGGATVGYAGGGESGAIGGGYQLGVGGGSGGNFAGASVTFSGISSAATYRSVEDVLSGT